jgi:antitoxin component of MazEF toxin-antitoxin module
MSNSFVVPLKKWGNSYVLKVPPTVAKLYKLDQELKVTIEEASN